MADHDRRRRQLPKQSRPISHGPEITIRTVGSASQPLKPQPNQHQQLPQQLFDDQPREDDEEFRGQRNDPLERLHSFHAPYEGLNFLFSPLDSYSSRSVAATYQDGTRLVEVRNDPAVIQPKIGTNFLAGADTPQVNQMEEISMTQTVPDQKTPAWRVMTAGALLTNFTFSKAMTIEYTDITPSIVQAFRCRHTTDGQFVNPNSPSRAISTRRNPNRLLTINSDNVKIVNDLSLSSLGTWKLSSSKWISPASSLLSQTTKV